MVTATRAVRTGTGAAGLPIEDVGEAALRGEGVWRGGKHGRVATFATVSSAAGGNVLLGKPLRSTGSAAETNCSIVVVSRGSGDRLISEDSSRLKSSILPSEGEAMSGAPVSLSVG